VSIKVWYYLIVTTIFKCNHDIHCFIGGNGPNITYYIYKTYNQNQIEFENIVAFHFTAFNKWVGWKSNLPNNVIVNIKGHQKILSMICSLFYSKRLWLWWLAYIYFEMVPFMSLMNLLCYSSGTFKYFYECGYYGGFICKIIKWRCGYIHIHYRLFMPSIFIGTCPFMHSPQLPKKILPLNNYYLKNPTLNGLPTC
jgi:hypothetical protein